MALCAIGAAGRATRRGVLEISGINLAPEETSIYRIVQAIIQLLQGRSNAVGEVTLRANQTTTVVTKAVARAAVNVSADSEVFLTPLTANAAAAVPTTYVSSVVQGGFTLTHASNAQINKTFGWVALG